MKALILAAGRGTRLGLDGDGPKCLAHVGGATLLDRYLNVLDGAGVDVTIVVGHAASHIRAHVQARAVKPALIMNERFTEGSILSLATGLAEIIEPAMRDAVVVQPDNVPARHPASGGHRDAENTLLLLDGDVAFTESLLTTLVHAVDTDALLVDIGTVFTDEQYMAGMHGTRVHALRRGPVDGHETQGEWVGFAKLSTDATHALYRAIAQQIGRGETSGGYEDALARLLPSIPFAAIPTGGLPWVEIDFVDDLERARRLFPDD